MFEKQTEGLNTQKEIVEFLKKELKDVSLWKLEKNSRIGETRIVDGIEHKEIHPVSDYDLLIIHKKLNIKIYCGYCIIDYLGRAIHSRLNQKYSKKLNKYFDVAKNRLLKKRDEEEKYLINETIDTTNNTINNSLHRMK